MLDSKMLTALNKQVNKELNSAYIYQAMSADLADKNRPGAANWMQEQAKEELGHAMKIYAYIQSRDAIVELQSIPAPQNTWKSEKEIFSEALKHEEYISSCILKLIKSAKETDDTATEIFLQWFVTEQLEEESTVKDILIQFEQVGDTPHGLYLLDKELGQRVQV